MGVVLGQRRVAGGGDLWVVGIGGIDGRGEVGRWRG